jgi:hypothetical protein
LRKQTFNRKERKDHAKDAKKTAQHFFASLAPTCNLPKKYRTTSLISRGSGPLETTPPERKLRKQTFNGKERKDHAKDAKKTAQHFFASFAPPLRSSRLKAFRWESANPVTVHKRDYVTPITVACVESQ